LGAPLRLLHLIDRRANLEAPYAQFAIERLAVVVLALCAGFRGATILLLVVALAPVVFADLAHFVLLLVDRAAPVAGGNFRVALIALRGLVGALVGPLADCRHPFRARMIKAHWGPPLAGASQFR